MNTAVIVKPEIPENTGFIARLAANFDFSLRIVNPEFNLEEARKTASGAQQKLRQATIFDTVQDAVKDLDYVVGTKPGRGVSLKEFQPRENTSVMIGPESRGLSNHELELCDAITHIETSEYKSINQSHASAIMFHSFFTLSQDQGMNKGQKQKIAELTSEIETELIKKANPTQEEADRLIGELSGRD